MIKLLFISLLLLSDAGRDVDHALYISVTEIEVQEERFSITVKVFSDDLYSCMFNRDKTIESTMDNPIEKEIVTYFTEYLHIEEGDNSSDLEFSTLSAEGDSYFLRFNQSRSPNSDFIKIQLGYFYELFPTQRNILKFKNSLDQQHRIFKSEDQIETLLLSSSDQ